MIAFFRYTLNFLQHHEANAINEALSLTPPVAPKSFCRYVDDSHARFKSNEEVEKFFEILNNQHQKIRYTMECEDSEKTLNFLDVSVMNRNEKYEFNVYRKKAITNVQVKPTSCHDPKILDGIFIGFVNRAYAICDDKYIEKELQFLINVFAENGYDINRLKSLIEKFNQKREVPNENSNSDPDQRMIVSLPWVPGLSQNFGKPLENRTSKPFLKVQVI